LFVSRYLIKDQFAENLTPLADSTVRDFIGQVAARTCLPGGGCVAALVASLGGALATMCSQLTYGNKKHEMYDKEIRDVLPQFYQCYNKLRDFIDDDSKAFTGYTEANKLPNTTEEEKEK
jgi:formiminotetrahydrofolate cyclodeaminase